MYQVILLGIILVVGYIGSVTSAPSAHKQSPTPTPSIRKLTEVATPTATLIPTKTPTDTPTPTNKLVPTIQLPTATPMPSADTSSGLSNDNYYTNTQGNSVHSPAYSDSAPAGASAICGDGTYSFSQSRRGTCSHHGGVAQWL